MAVITILHRTDFKQCVIPIDAKWGTNSLLLVNTIIRLTR